MLSRLRSFASALLRRARFEKTMTDEMRFHVDAYVEDLVRSGLPAGEALRRARVEFGSVELVKEECRQARGLQLIEEVRQDVRYALRQMSKSPVFTAVAVLSLAAGIGANTAIFSVMDVALFRMMQVRDPERLFFLGHRLDSDLSTSSNYPLFERYQETPVFEGVAAYSSETFLVKTADGMERVNGQFVSGNYHAVMGAPVVMGRGFSGERDRDLSTNAIAVISDGYWQRKFGRNRDVIGRSFHVGGREVTIVGVTAPGFEGLFPGWSVDVTLPMSVHALDEPSYLDARDGWISLTLVARLRAGVTEEQALAVTSPIFKRFWMEPENEWARQGANAELRSSALIPAGRGSDELRGRYGTALWILLAMTATVLLIACANVANLLLARATTRAREVTVRLSIGAGRFRLIRQFLTESCLLAAMGGLLGLAASFWSTRALLSFFGDGEYPVLLDVSLNTNVLAFTAAISLLTGLTFGLVPSFRATRVDLTPALKRTGGGSHHAFWAGGKTLIAAQIALCMLLVAASALLVRSLRNLKNVDTGFARDNVVLFNVEIAQSLESTAQRMRFYNELLESLRALPGVQAVSLAKRSPMDFSSETRRLTVPGYDQSNVAGGVSSNIVTPEYFRALGIELVRGRSFTDQDRDGSLKVALASEMMARTYFDDKDALGRIIVLGGRRDTLTIVGIVRDVRHEELRNAAPLSVYTPLAQPSEDFDGRLGVPGNVTAMVRTGTNPLALAPSVIQEVRALGADAVVSYVRTMDQQLDVALVRERLLANLSTAFGILALVLAATGLYGVMSYSVARRARDIGIRMALGATRGMTMAHILREVLTVAVIGIGVGVGASLASTRMVATFLYGLSPTDPLTLSAVAVILLLTILLAGYIPARHAAAVDPVKTLKAE